MDQLYSHTLLPVVRETALESPNQRREGISDLLSILVMSVAHASTQAPQATLDNE